MSSISSVLKNSRLAQLPKSRVKLDSKKFRVKHFPTHQIVETKPATLSRQEWGLKSNIPNKIKSKYIVLDELDTLERMTEFEPIGGTQWTRLRFQEMGVVPDFQQGRSNPMFPFADVVRESQLGAGASGAVTGDDQLRELCNQLGVSEKTKASTLRKTLASVKKNRDGFKTWALQRDPEALSNKKFNSDELKGVAKKFLNETFNMNNEAAKIKNAHRFVGTGGLSYGLKGRLRNSPNGAVQKTIVPGRITNYGKQEIGSAAIGGFVANCSGYENKRNSYNKGDFIRESVYPFRIEHVSIGNNGQVQIKANGNILMNGGGHGSGSAEMDGHIRGRRGPYGLGYNRNRLMQQQQQQKNNSSSNAESVKEKASELVERLRNMTITH